MKFCNSSKNHYSSEQETESWNEDFGPSLHDSRYDDWNFESIDTKRNRNDYDSHRTNSVKECQFSSPENNEIWDFSDTSSESSDSTSIKLSALEDTTDMKMSCKGNSGYKSSGNASKNNFSMKKLKKSSKKKKFRRKKNKSCGKRSAQSDTNSLRNVPSVNTESSSIFSWQRKSTKPTQENEAIFGDKHIPRVLPLVGWSWCVCARCACVWGVCAFVLLGIVLLLISQFCS